MCHVKPARCAQDLGSPNHCATRGLILGADEEGRAAAHALTPPRQGAPQLTGSLGAGDQRGRLTHRCPPRRPGRPIHRATGADRNPGVGYPRSTPTAGRRRRLLTRAVRTAAYHQPLLGAARSMHRLDEPSHPNGKGRNPCSANPAPIPVDPGRRNREGAPDQRPARGPTCHHQRRPGPARNCQGPDSDPSFRRRRTLDSNHQDRGRHPRRPDQTPMDPGPVHRQIHPTHGRSRPSPGFPPSHHCHRQARAPRIHPCLPCLPLVTGSLPSARVPRSISGIDRRETRALGGHA